MNIEQALTIIGAPVALHKGSIIDPTQPDRVVWREAPGKFVVRQDTGQPLAHVGDDYALINHADALRPTLQALDGLDWAVKDVLVDRDLLRARIKLYGPELEVCPGDPLRLCIALSSSYDGGSSIRFDAFIGRMVCMNGLTVPSKDWADQAVRARVRHAYGALPKLADLPARVGHLHDVFARAVETYKALANKPVSFTSEALQALLVECLGERALEPVLQLASHGKGQDGSQTAWAVYNGATEYLTRKAERSNTPVSAEDTANRRGTALLDALVSL